MKLEPILQMGTDGLTLRCAYHKPYMVNFPDRCEWQNRFQLDIKWGLVWYTYMGLIPITALMLGCTDGNQEGAQLQFWAPWHSILG